MGFAGKVERNRTYKKQIRAWKGWVPKGSYRSESPHGRDEDGLIPSDELDGDLAAEFRGLRVEDENVQGREEGEGVGYEPETYGKASDSVRFYLMEMGSFPLLTREGEVEIAKRIESGKRNMLNVVLRCPVAVKETLRLGGALRAGSIDVREVTNEVDDEENDIAKEQIQKKRVLNLIKKIERGEESIRRLRMKSRSRKKEPTQKKIQEQIWRRQAEIFNTLMRINLRDKQIDRIVKKLKQWDMQIETAKREAGDSGTPVRKSGKPLRTIDEKEPKRSPFCLAGTKSRLRDRRGADRALRNLKERLDRMEVECGLSSDQIKKAVKAIEKEEAETNEAKIQMVKANVRLVISIARRYLNRGLPFPDLIQEGNIGLMKAVDKFEYQRGYKFGTYATWWIRQAIIRAISDQARTIRIPVHMIEIINKLNRTSRTLVQENGREPTLEEIAEKMGMSLEKAQKILKITQRPISLETPIGEEEDSRLEDFIEDKEVISPQDAAIGSNMAKQIQIVLSGLDKREEKILRMRFGIGEKHDHTLEEVGQYFELTRERIRQIEDRALRKLKYSSGAERLRSFIKN